MCGLVAVITKNTNGFTSEQRDIFSLLLYLDVIRGEDSTGIFVVDNIGNVALAKDNTPAADFIRTKEYKDLKANAFQNGWAMVGHNRKATMGTITDRNAHPFAVDDKIVLVHNGTLVGSHKHHADTDVDSEAIAHLLAKNDDPEQVLRKVNGAFALIWYNVDEKKLHVVRNSQRPLCFVETNNEFIFASEMCFLEFVVSKFNLKPTKEGGPYLLKEEHLFSMELLDNKKMKLYNRDMDIGYHKHNPSQTGGAANARSPFPFPPKSYTENEDADTVEWWEEYYGHRGRAHTQPTAPALTWKRPANEADITGKFLDAVKADCKTITYQEFQTLQKVITSGEHIKTIVSDLTEADNDPKTTNYLFIGKPVGLTNIYSMFQLREDDWGEAFRMANEGLFDMEIKRISWHRTESQDTKKDMADWLGVCCIHGEHAKFIDMDLIPTLDNVVQNVSQLH